LTNLKVQGRGEEPEGQSSQCKYIRERKL
jgi:hypothetical protein